MLSWVIACLLLVISLVYEHTMAYHCLGGAMHTRKTSMRLYGFMDAMKKALESDPNLQPAQDPGLSNGVVPIEVEFKGPKNVKVSAYPGQKLRDVASSARVPIKYSCKKGDCATCEVNFNGKIVKACQASLPSKGGGKVVIGVPVK